jgi:hypothetical protein
LCETPWWTPRIAFFTSPNHPSIVYHAYDRLGRESVGVALDVDLCGVLDALVRVALSSV